MAKVIPFKAVRPTRAIVGLVASRSYQSYTQPEREARLDYNPFSFLHITNPEFKSIVKTKPNSVERFKLVSDSYQRFIEEGVLFNGELTITHGSEDSEKVLKTVNSETFSPFEVKS